MKYTFIKNHRHKFSINNLCRVFKVSRSAYYDGLKSCQQMSVRAKANQQLSERIKEIFMANRSCYGSRRIRRVLLNEGFTVSRRRVCKLMKALNLRCKTKRKFKITTDSKHTLPISPNVLNRHFSPKAPDTCYASDITYIHTQEGWLYLAVVMDLFSRQVVGWSMNKHMKASLVNDALLMALWKRKPAKGLLSHSDRGSQYAANSHRDILKDHGIIQSMSRKGNCWDNSVVESFFHTLKTECVYQESFKTRHQAREVIFEYIEVFYNRIRLHSANDYLSPVEFEKARLAK